MARLRRDESRLYGFEIAHFADQYDVRVLAQAPSQGLREGTRVDIDLTLGDERLFVLVKKLDRVLDRDDVAVSLLVYMIDDGCKGRRFTGTGGSGNKYQSAILVRDRIQYRRKTQL